MPMLQMPVIAGKAALDRVIVHFPAAVFLLKGFQPPLKSTLIACPQAAYDLARIGQVKMPTKIVYALGNRKNLRFFIQLKFQLFSRKRPDFRKTGFQVFFILMQQNQIVHIPGIVFDFVFFLDDTVYPVKIIQGKPLAGLITHWQPFSRIGIEAVDNLIQKRQNLLIGETPEQIF